MWAKRWRERWGARYGKLRLRDDIPVAEMEQKVLFFRVGGCRFLVGVGCGKRTCFWCRIPAPKTGPVSGPLIIISTKHTQPGAIFGSGIWHPKWYRFPDPKCGKNSTCRVAVVQLLCSPSGCRQGTALGEFRRDFRVIVPRHASRLSRLGGSSRPDTCRWFVQILSSLWSVR